MSDSNTRRDATKLDRRRLLKIAGSSTSLIIVGGCLAGCGNPTGAPPSGPVMVGNVSALSAGTLLVFSNVAVARDDRGLYGMSAVCTHAGCLLDGSGASVAGGLSCPCHGSTFSGDGAVTRGPAHAALQHYAVTVAADGAITVDGSPPVAADVRTPIS